MAPPITASSAEAIGAHSHQPEIASASVPGVTLHARKQMLARYGFDLPREAWLSVVLSILDRRALLLGENYRGTGAQKWRVAAPTGEVDVVWLPKDGQVVTVLPFNSPAIDPKKRAAREARMRGESRLAISPRNKRAWMRDQDE